MSFAIAVGRGGDAIDVLDASQATRAPGSNTDHL
jgi:hypothetical protein